MEGSIIDIGIRADSEVFDADLNLARFTLCAFDEFGERYLTALVLLNPSDGQNVTTKHKFASERRGLDEDVTLVDLYARSWHSKDDEERTWDADTISRCHFLFIKMLMYMSKMYGVSTFQLNPKYRIGVDKSGFDVYKRYTAKRIDDLKVANTDALMRIFFEEDEE